MKKYVIGMDYGTLSVRASLFNLENGEEIASGVREYEHAVMDQCLPGGKVLENGYALQDPRDYLEGLRDTIREIMTKSGVNPEDVLGIGVDFTASTILPVYEDGTPLCFMEKYREEPQAYVKLWKHHGAQKEADRINESATEESWIVRYGGKISPEWMWPKILETLHKNEEVYRETAYFVEAGDWIVWQLTGQKVVSSCMAGYKAFWSEENGYPANEFWKKLDNRLDGIIGTKITEKISCTGSYVGTLTKEAAKMLGLTENTKVAAAVIDAHAALPSLGIVNPGRMLMIVGTSGCHIMLDEKDCRLPGICGVVKDGIVPGYYAYEGGQSAVGDLFDWFVKNGVPGSYERICHEQGKNIHKFLQEKAEKLQPGGNGLLALDWWNGNRSVLINGDLSGMLVGMTLQTKPEEIYRALLEAVAFGTKVIIDTFTKNGVEIRELYAAGGIPAKNELLMQIYTDVLNREIFVCAKTPSPALGSAVFAAAACGYYKDVESAAEKMAKNEFICYSPIEENVKRYQKLFGMYQKMHDYFGVECAEFMKELKGL